MQSLIDKIIIYGVPNPEKLNLTEVLNNKIKVQTLEFYSSPTSQTPQFMQKIDFQMWAYPDGIKIYNDRFQIVNDNQPEFSFFQPTDLIHDKTKTNNALLNKKQLPQSIYSFVLTDYDLNRTYCTSIVWNQVYFINDDRPSLTTTSQPSQPQPLPQTFKAPKQHYSLAVPKCTVNTMINNPLLLDPNTVLVYLPKVMILVSKTPCIQFQRTLLKYYHESVIVENLSREKKMLNIPKIFQQDFNTLIKNYGYPKAESLFNHGKTQTLRKIQLQLLKCLFISDSQKDKPLGMLSLQTSKLREFYLSALFTVPLDNKHSYLITENGRRIAAKLKSDTVFHLPKVYDLCSQQFQNTDKSFPPLLPLPISSFIQLWKCLLLQKQIIIFSNSQYKSIMLSQFLLYLIQPIIWENIYIPFLPFHLAHHIDAIGGYLIGMSRIHMDYMLEKFDMKTKVVVDLDYQTILEQGGKQVIELPEQIKSYIQISLKSVLQSYQQSKKSNKGLINYLSLNPQQPSTLHQKIRFKQNFIQATLQIQKTFFHALVVLFNNFVPFINKKQDGIIEIKTEEYLSILENKLHKIFMKEIAKTMVFIRLCQYHVDQSEKCAWVQKTIGELFVYSHDILSHKFIVDDMNKNKINVENSNTNKKSLNSQKSAKTITPFQITTSKQNKPSQQSPLPSILINNTPYQPIASTTLQPQTPPKPKEKSKRAYAWKLTDLLNKQQKYCQYIEYLFDKNLKQLTHIIDTVEEYLAAEQNKYQILMSENQFTSFEALQAVKLPLNFGNPPREQSTTSISKDKQKQQKIIYQQLYKQQAIKSKKWKKFGETDEEDLYDELPKLCTQTKIQKLLIKYLKQLQLNHPDTVSKARNNKNKKKKKKSSVLEWLWDLVNPSDISRTKQQSQLKWSIQKKLANKLSKIEIVNLNHLFQQNPHGLTDEQLDPTKKKQKQADNAEMKLMAMNPHSKIMGVTIGNDQGTKTSRMFSDVVKCERESNLRQEKL